MKNKPTRKQISTSDLPKFKSGKNWRVNNSSNKIKDAIQRNMTKKN